MLQSGRETWFFDADQPNIDKKGVSVCLVYNGHNHYCPSLVINKDEFTRFQLDQLVTISTATIDLINEIDLQNIKEDKKVQQVNELEEVLRRTLTVLGKKQPGQKSRKTLRTVLWGGASVDAPHGFPDVPASSGKPSSLPKRPVGRTMKYCDHCSYQTDRSQDMKRHLWAVHEIGEGDVAIYCKEGACAKLGRGKGKRFSSRFTLEGHRQTQHLGVYRYVCQRDNCNFGTEGRQIYRDHMLKVHKRYISSTKPNLKCAKCEKKMSGVMALKRHQKRDTCTKKKNFQCGVCAKWLISQSGLRRHKAIFHGQKAVPQCGRCGKMIASKASMAQHMARHKEWDKINRAKDLQKEKQRLEKEGRRFSKQMTSKLKGKLPPKKPGKESASVKPKKKKSTPLAPRRSARK